MLAPTRRAFFNSRPVLLPPTLDGRCVLLEDHALRLLGRKAQVVQDATDIVRVVRHAKLLAGDVRHAAAGPQVGAIPGGQRTGLQEDDELVFLLRRKLRRGTRVGLTASDFTPSSYQARFQRFTLERWAPTRSATSGRGFRAWKYSAARRRRASSSIALPLVLINPTTAIAPTMVLLPRSSQ